MPLAYFIRCYIRICIQQITLDQFPLHRPPSPRRRQILNPHDSVLRPRRFPGCRSHRSRVSRLQPVYLRRRNQRVPMHQFCRQTHRALYRRRRRFWHQRIHVSRLFLVRRRRLHLVPCDCSTKVHCNMFATRFSKFENHLCNFFIFDMFMERSASPPRLLGPRPLPVPPDVSPFLLDTPALTSTYVHVFIAAGSPLPPSMSAESPLSMRTTPTSKTRSPMTPITLTLPKSILTSPKNDCVADQQKHVLVDALTCSVPRIYESVQSVTEFTSAANAVNVRRFCTKDWDVVVVSTPSAVSAITDRVAALRSANGPHAKLKLIIYSRDAAVRHSAVFREQHVDVSHLTASPSPSPDACTCVMNT